MKYISTRGKSKPVDFRTALFSGLAPDGGLYVPESIPKLSDLDREKILNSDLITTAQIVLNAFIEEISQPDLIHILNKALTFPIPLKKVGNNYVLELFHGPTMAFKDVAAQVLAQLMSYYLQKQDKKITIFVATSGDTGGAVAQGFSNVGNIDVIVLFPKNRISKLQYDQLTQVADNIFPFEIEGSFDKCQSILKKLLLDEDIKKLNPTSANSINIGRLLPQIIYYVYLGALLNFKEFEVTIPSGNMGNATAALMAQQMGIPISKIHIATNINDVVVEYFKTEAFRPKKSVLTFSNAMDIGNPSNFERIMFFLKNDFSTFKQIFDATAVNDEETTDTIKTVYRKYNYILDPHTAVAWKVAENLSTKLPQVVVSTAAPLKFAEEINKRTSILLKDKNLNSNYKMRKFTVPADYNQIKKKILD